jgi:hypothetical protein
MNPDDILEHAHACLYQPVECLAGYGAQHVLTCGWKGKKHDLLGHVRNQHGLTMVHTDQPRLFTPPFVLQYDRMETVLLCAQSELFWFTLKFDVKNNIRHEILHFIGPATKAKKFRYTCEYVTYDGITGTSFFSTTRIILRQKGNVFSSSPHFQIPLDLFQKLFVDKKGHVRGYKLTVEKVSGSER